jgi:uncharacterized damage-inducible protein DinB
MLRTVVVAAVTVSLALPALARAQAPAVAPAAAPAAPSLKAEYLAEVADVEQKIRALAEAIPEEKYGWRPAPGIRSVAQLFAHVAGGNYLLTGLSGAATPADVPEDLEKITKKSELLVWLDKSFAHLRASLDAAAPEQMAKAIDFYGQKTTGRGLYFKAYGHMSEHLGQAIAYARSIGVTPPWNKKAS